MKSWFKKKFKQEEKGRFLFSISVDKAQFVASSPLCKRSQMPKHWSCSINFRDRRWLMINKGARLTIHLQRWSLPARKNDPSLRLIVLFEFLSIVSVLPFLQVLFFYSDYSYTDPFYLFEINSKVGSRNATSCCIVYCILFDQIKIEYTKCVSSSRRHEHPSFLNNIFDIPDPVSFL